MPMRRQLERRCLEGSGRIHRVAQVATRSLGRAAALSLLAIAWLTLSAQPASAGPREQAKRIHDRLVGTPPSAAVLDAMATILSTPGADPLDAALLAMQDPEFYRTALKNYFTPFTNEEQTAYAPLNDYSATAIGMLRDDVPWNEVLSADLVYRGAQGVVSTGYSHTNNDHYVELEENRIDLGDPALFVGVPQSSIGNSPLMSQDTAGVVTTRQGAAAFFSAGTNRRMWRFTAMNFLCRDMEELKDISRPADRIRQDVTRSPGGDSSLFMNHCVGCHSGMDPMAQAYAYYEWDDVNMRLDYTPGMVQGKYLINANAFPGGFVTVDDRWDNMWRAGDNYVLGWPSTPAGGFGAKSLGYEVTGSRAFSECQVQRVFERVCFRTPNSQADADAIRDTADSFEANNYSLKRVFAEVAVHCMGN